MGLNTPGWRGHGEKELARPNMVGVYIARVRLGMGEWHGGVGMGEWSCKIERRGIIFKQQDLRWYTHTHRAP